MFDPNANPEAVSARAAELALEQLERFRHRIKRFDSSDKDNINAEAMKFYAEPFEVQISNNVSKLMAGYAVLKGYVTEEQASR